MKAYTGKHDTCHLLVPHYHSEETDTFTSIKMELKDDLTLEDENEPSNIL